MSPNPVTLEPELRASAALRRMQVERIRHAPVLERGQLAGIVTDRDLLRALPGTIGELDRSDAPDPQLARIMSRDLVTVEPNTRVADAANLLLERKIHGLPVVEEGRLVGMLTDTDLFQVFARLFAGPADHRLTLLSTPDQHDPEQPDLVRTAVACGLEIATVVRQELAQGETVSEVAVNGSGEAVERYLARLAAVGVTRLDWR